MCPAIHINSRSWLRSSSTHEPSDPPLRVVFPRHTRVCCFRFVPRRPRNERAGGPLRPSRSRRLLYARRFHEVKETAPRGDAAGRPSTRTISLNLATLELPPDASVTVRARYPAKMSRLSLRTGGWLPASSRGMFGFATFASVKGTTKSRLRSIRYSVMILPQVHLRKPCYDFYDL